MLVRWVWPNCDFRENKWGAEPIDSFWVEATYEEAETIVFPKLHPEQIQKSKKFAQDHQGAAALVENSGNPYTFLVARDASTIDPMPMHYPISNLWNAYSPFEEISEMSINSLDELRTLRQPRR